MKKLSKTNILLLVFLSFANLIFSQDYYKLSQDFFNDTKTVHVNYVKKAIQENNAEQLVIDLYNLTSEHEDDIERVNNKIKSLEDNFKANYENPDNAYECRKAIEYKDEAESAETSISYFKSSVSIAKNSYSLCKNNVYRTGNCNQQLNNYNKQLDLYDNAVRRYNAAKDNYNYYRPDCNKIASKYDNAFNYVKQQIDNLIANQKQRINERERKDRSYRSQLNEIFLNTPMLYVEYYDNGNKSKEGYIDLRTNNYVGNLKQYYGNGNLKSTATFVNNALEGQAIEYYGTGEKKIVAEYKNGTLNGDYSEYYETGDLKYEINHLDGKYHGNYIEYFETGIKKIDSNFKEGKLQGLATLYYENGVKREVVYYDNGNPVQGKGYNREGTDFEVLSKKLHEDIDLDGEFYKSIDNSSVTNSIETDSIRTIKENNIELVIDFSKASKETINYVLVRPDHEKSIELRKKYIENYWQTDGAKVSYKIFDTEGNILKEFKYDNRGVILKIHLDGGYRMVGLIKNGIRNGGWGVYDNTGYCVGSVTYEKGEEVKRLIRDKTVILK